MYLKTTVIFLLLTVLPLISYSQNQKSEELAKFIITEATINNEDVTEYHLEQSACIVFYSVKNDDLVYMANYWEKNNTQSYGPMIARKTRKNKETEEDYKSDEFYFSWRYTNTYDGKIGTAKVALTKIYKPNGISFVIKIIPENLDVIVYSGYMEGSIDFSNY